MSAGGLSHSKTLPSGVSSPRQRSSPAKTSAYPLVNISELIASLRVGVFTDVVRTYVPAESVEEQWDVKSLQSVLAAEWSLDVPLEQMLIDEPNLNDDDILEKVLAAADDPAQAKEAKPEHMDAILRVARQHYDYIVLDVGRQIDAVSLRALDSTDIIYPVLQLALPDIRDARRLLDIFRSLG